MKRTEVKAIQQKKSFEKNVQKAYIYLRKINYSQMEALGTLTSTLYDAIDEIDESQFEENEKY